MLPMNYTNGHLTSVFDTFDNLLSDIFSPNWKFTEGHPHTNIIKTDDYTYRIEMAVAGIDKEDISVFLDNNVLTVSYEKKQEVIDDKWKYVHRGISGRSFKKYFELGDNVEVKEPTLKNGILTIELEIIVPEHKKAKKLTILS